MKNSLLLKLSIGLGLLTIIRIIVAASIPLSPDEAYYWVWSQHLDYSFYDHPPMVALWIKLGCLIWGDTSLGVRFIAPIAAFLGSIFVFFATLDFTQDNKNNYIQAIFVTLILNATLAIGVGAVTMTPDTPLLFFISLFLWGCGRLLKTQNHAWWWCIGVCVGFALLSKYTALLPVLALGIWCFITQQGRSYLKGYSLWGGGLLSILIFFPVILWNFQHHWISFLKQGGRAGDWNPYRALQFLSELLGGQIGLLTPVIFLTCGVAFFYLTRLVFRKKQTIDIFLWLMVVVPSCVFIQHALGDRVQANWVGIIYPSLAIMAGVYTRFLLKTGIVIGGVITCLVYIQAMFAFFPLPAKADMTLKRLSAWQELAEQIDQNIELNNIITDEYGLASELKFYLPNRPIFSVDQRWQYFNIPTSLVRSGYLIRTARRKDMPSSQYFSHIQKIGVVERKRGHEVAESYNIYKVTIADGNQKTKQIVTLP